MPKLLLFTQHAETVITERLLERHWVERAVSDPDWTKPDTVDPSMEHRFLTIPEREDRVLRVVCVETETEIRVVSAFLDRGARRHR